MCSYTSPELLIGKRYVGPEIDAWGMYRESIRMRVSKYCELLTMPRCLYCVWVCSGVNMYVMLTGRLPFKGDNIIKLHAQMLEHKFSIPDRLSPGNYHDIFL